MVTHKKKVDSKEQGVRKLYMTCSAVSMAEKTKEKISKENKYSSKLIKISFSLPTTKEKDIHKDNKTGSYIQVRNLNVGINEIFPTREKCACEITKSCKTSKIRTRIHRYWDAKIEPVTMPSPIFAIDPAGRRDKGKEKDSAAVHCSNPSFQMPSTLKSSLGVDFHKLFMPQRIFYYWNSLYHGKTSCRVLKTTQEKRNWYAGRFTQTRHIKGKKLLNTVKHC